MIVLREEQFAQYGIDRDNAARVATETAAKQARVLLRRGKYREGLNEKWLGRVPDRAGLGRCLWLHAVSVGEVNLLVPLVADLARRRPGQDIVVSATSRAGYQLARQRFPGRIVCYAPLDFSWAVRRAIRRLRPEIMIIMDAEKQTLENFRIVDLNEEKTTEGGKQSLWIERGLPPGSHGIDATKYYID